MRLHRLGATAFGPFVDPVEVDFDALSDAGLFLLSGATGAGKSSVLDAVCFALYGAIPGDRHHAHRLRSDQAPPGLAPRVELEVSLSSRRFRIVRSPAWERPKKRGAGLTREPAKATVSEHRGGEWCPLTSRLDEAGDLLSGLLGMNLDQFCQVALLPQGHFQAFLRADSAQRHQLLARLFRTSRFERVEVWLREHRLALRRASQTHVATISDLVSRLSEAGAVEVPEEVRELSAPGADAVVGSWMGLLGSTTTDALEAAVLAADTSQEAARAAGVAWELARERAQARDRAVLAAASHARLLDESDAQQEAVARLEGGRRAAGLRPLTALVGEREVRHGEALAASERTLAEASAAGIAVADLAGEVARLTADITRMRVLLPAEQRLTELRVEHAHDTDELAVIRRDDELAEAEVAALDDLLERVSDELRLATEAAQALTSAEGEAVRLREIAQAHESLPGLRAQLTLATDDHRAALTQRLELREHLLDLRERRIAGMAAELAGVLAVGDDCPVCGSADHPHPAVPGAGHPDADDERAAQRAVDDAQAVEHAQDLRVRDAATSLAAAEQAAAAVSADAVAGMLTGAEQRLAETTDAAARQSALTEQRQATERRLAAGRQQSDVRRLRRAELTTSLAHRDEQIRELTLQVDDARGQHAALGAAVADADQQASAAQSALSATAAQATARAALEDAQLAWTQAAVEAGFDSGAAARACEVSPEELAELDDLVRQHQGELAATAMVLAEPGSPELLASPAVDLGPLERSHEQAATAAEAARAARDRARGRADRMAGLVSELQLALGLWAPVREQLELATSLSAFAEGKAPDNRLQMRLSAYVLSHRLTQVVAAANARLAGMSDQRYSLEHVGQRGAGEARGGLSLLVRDDWSGESRDPATLSGGETFVVSLALALGLADVVAHEAGGADLATLFVDEGFGSLDAETLDDVLDILDTLRENGRAVGVVSHVAEMRDRIPTQLMVSKARTGSTVRVSC